MKYAFVSRALGASVLAAALAATPAVVLAQTLDGRAFLADAGEKGKPADEKNDLVTFAGGMFHSQACDQFGYGKGAYKATSAGDAITFEAETKSEKDGRLVWKGTVRGSDIEGTFTHYRKGWLLNPNPDPIEHWFKGKAKT